MDNLEFSKDVNYYRNLRIDKFDLLLCRSFSGHRILRRSYGLTSEAYKYGSAYSVEVLDEKIISHGSEKYIVYDEISSMHKSNIIKNFGNITIEEFEKEYPEWTI